MRNASNAPFTASRQQLQSRGGVFFMVTQNDFDWGSALIEMGCRIVPMLPMRKIPFASPFPEEKTGLRWLVINDTERWERFRLKNPNCNVSIIWPGVQLDCDSDEALDWARKNGLKDHRNWTIHTGRGTRSLFAAPDVYPTTFIDPSHEIPDILAPGRLSLVPPSIHPTGRPYEWAPGYSPLEIPLHDIDPLPEELLKSWQRLEGGSVRKRGRLLLDSQTPSWLSPIFVAICEFLKSRGHVIRESSNGGFTTTCPFHDDTHPSFSFHPVRGWNCFAGCGHGRLTALAARLGVRVSVWR